MLGGHPSPAAIATYFVVATAALLGAAELLPDRLKPLAYGAVVGVEGYAVAGNIDRTGLIGVQTGHVR